MLKLKVHCGCGFYKEGNILILTHGSDHAKATGHEVEVRGTITNEESIAYGDQPGLQPRRTQTGRLKSRSLDNE